MKQLFHVEWVARGPVCARCNYYKTDDEFSFELAINSRVAASCGGFSTIFMAAKALNTELDRFVLDEDAVTAASFPDSLFIPSFYRREMRWCVLAADESGYHDTGRSFCTRTEAVRTIGDILVRNGKV